jgi:hypothetical protein
MGHPVVGGIEANTEILAFDFAQARMTAWWDGRSRGREQSRATARDNPPFAMKPQRMGHPGLWEHKRQIPRFWPSARMTAF